jgi:hypothetical protein
MNIFFCGWILWISSLRLVLGLGTLRQVPCSVCLFYVRGIIDVHPVRVRLLPSNGNVEFVYYSLVGLQLARGQCLNPIVVGSLGSISGKMVLILLTISTAC